MCPRPCVPDPRDRALEPVGDEEHHIRRDLQPGHHLPDRRVRGRRCVGPCCRGDRARRPFLRAFAPSFCRLRSHRGGTHVRLVTDARIDDFWLQSGMNRLRHAYLDISAPARAVFRDGPSRRPARPVRDVRPRHGEPVPPDCQHVHGRRGDRRRSAGSSGASSQRSWAQDQS